MMQKRVVLVSAAVAVLGLAAAVLGFVSESAKSKAFVRYDGERCVYRRTAAFGCGIAAALLVLAGMAIATAAGGCLGRHGGATAPGHGRSTLSIIAWVVVLLAAMLFLYGAWRNSGGTSGLTRGRSGRRFNRTYYYGCAMLRGGVFATASVASAAATACAIAAYVSLQAAEPEPGVATGQPSQWSQPYPPAPPSQSFAEPGVAMGQPSQWSQPYPAAPPSQFAEPQWPQPYPPVAYPAPPHHGYGDGKQPAATA